MRGAQDVESRCCCRTTSRSTGLQAKHAVNIAKCSSLQDCDTFYGTALTRCLVRQQSRHCYPKQRRKKNQDDYTSLSNVTLDLFASYCSTSYCSWLLVS